MIEECKRLEPKLVEIKSKHFAACIRINAEKPYVDENEKKVWAQSAAAYPTQENKSK
jgi:hypothetical protein